MHRQLQMLGHGESGRKQRRRSFKRSGKRATSSRNSEVESQGDSSGKNASLSTRNRAGSASSCSSRGSGVNKTGALPKYASVPLIQGRSGGTVGGGSNLRQDSGPNRSAAARTGDQSSDPTQQVAHDTSGTGTGTGQNAKASFKSSPSQLAIQGSVKPMQVVSESDALRGRAVTSEQALLSGAQPRSGKQTRPR